MARQLIYDKQFYRRYLISVVGGQPIAMVAFLIAWMTFNERNALFWCSTAIFAAAPVAAFVRHRYLYTHHVCRQCGRSIQRTAESYEPDKRIAFHCAHCDIDWDTGLRNGGPS